MTSAAVAAEPPAFSVGRVISLTFSVLGRHLPLFFGVAFVASLPTPLISIFFLHRPVEGYGQNPFSGAYWGGLAVLWLVGIIFTFGLQAVLTYSTVMDLNGRRSSLAEALRHAIPIFLPLIAISILYSLGVALGFLALLVPGFMLLTAWAVAVPVRLIEDTAILDTFSRSAELTKGHRWAILGLLIVLGFIGLALGLVSRPLIGLLATPQAGAGVSLAYALLTGAVQAVTAMITATGTATLYFVLRTMKEGIAPEQLAAVFD